ncbi:hypothetical protein SAMN05192583_3666 [Sphingomonas gellani]|jgi:hypothetical protein|uniref:Uncharacterized protein n=5 Tax=Sphingomonas TaxID=13687 RepID=A0A1H8JSM9_9SPHN|nr:hypothetical protein [Sphingomonas pseudosanguinis]MBB4049246.1 hypothetical protein [Sphingomonas zeae]MBB4155628.1 hypothetical protein [Sphingomonas jinjuensis]MBB4610600.1 hypothetical protein [Sphingomonas yabuuchiae]MDR6129073.1 hypothetical protein [Sphingomonas sp. SORGH_AS_0438]NIJ31415.1 hypothetical protein [Sphingomonas insulae]NYD92363.1 hypothetical protein [Sphingomonas melonis]TCM26632.1 hypothetical protein EDF59_13420 [Novosphingobium sp. ST904]SEN83208.1 hypothetical p|tara:strand:+ start:503 stop:631 length:129 start_codon:yes stop_codon:yes gene_type:complete
MARRKSIAVPAHMLSDRDPVNQPQKHETIVLVRTDKMALATE